MGAPGLAARMRGFCALNVQLDTISDVNLFFSPCKSFSLSPFKQTTDSWLIALGEEYGQVKNRNVHSGFSDPKFP